MINFLLKNPFLYRLYQKSVRKKYSEYDFFKYIFKKINTEKIRLLDICCGDSYILEYINEYLDDYIGVDNNDKYLNQCKQKWKKYNFYSFDVKDRNNLKYIIDFNPNFIFINGAIHHLNNDTVKVIIKLITDNFPNCYFLSVDPIVNNNKILNKLMIKLDRGKFIRNKSQYNELMKPFNHFIIDDFYKMNFENIFHFKNINLEKLYNEWKIESHK